MIATLKDLRLRTGDRALLGSFQAALDRLEALAYRLTRSGLRAGPCLAQACAIYCRTLVAAARAAARPGGGRAQAEAALMLEKVYEKRQVELPCRSN